MTHRLGDEGYPGGIEYPLSENPDGSVSVTPKVDTSSFSRQPNTGCLPVKCSSGLLVRLEDCRRRDTCPDANASALGAAWHT